jgi:hypothetical protein
MMRIIYLLLLLHAPIAWGIETTKVTLEVGRIINMRDAYFSEYDLMDYRPVDGGEEPWSYHTALAVTTKMMETPLGHIYIDQEISGQSTTRQYRRVEWWVEAGLRIDNRVDIYRQHRSEHLLDATADSKYPVWDIYGIRVCLLGKGCD